MPGMRQAATSWVLTRSCKCGGHGRAGGVGCCCACVHDFVWARWSYVGGVIARWDGWALTVHELAKPFELTVREVVLCVIGSPAADSEPRVHAS